MISLRFMQTHKISEFFREGGTVDRWPSCHVRHSLHVFVVQPVLYVAHPIETPLEKLSPMAFPRNGSDPHEATYIRAVGKAFCTTSRSWISAAEHGVLSKGLPNLEGANSTETRLSYSGVVESPFEFIPLSFWAVLRCSMSLKTVEVVDQKEVPQEMAEFW